MAGVERVGGFERAKSASRNSWTFLTNHSNVLACIDQDPDIRLRDVAARVGITERAAQSIVADLVEAGYLSRERVGRRNRYGVHLDGPLRSPLGTAHAVELLVQLLRPEGAGPPSANSQPAMKAG